MAGAMDSVCSSSSRTHCYLLCSKRLSLVWITGWFVPDLDASSQLDSMGGSYADCKGVKKAIQQNDVFAPIADDVLRVFKMLDALLDLCVYTNSTLRLAGSPVLT